MSVGLQGSFSFSGITQLVPSAGLGFHSFDRISAPAAPYIRTSESRSLVIQSVRIQPMFCNRHSSQLYSSVTNPGIICKQHSSSPRTSTLFSSAFLFPSVHARNERSHECKKHNPYDGHRYGIAVKRATMAATMTEECISLLRECYDGL